MKNLSVYIFLIINHPSLLGSFLEECELLCPCEIKKDKTMVKINVKPNSWSVWTEPKGRKAAKQALVLRQTSSAERW